jgi:peptidoglycan/xylan/chitin deacetylase (PgdA/CDA1 family)
MNKKEIIELSNKWYEIVTHTLNHKELNSLDYINQKKEIKDSRNQLEKITGKKINAIIYPAWKYNKTTLKILKELNFDFGFTTKNWKFKNWDNKFEIKRMRIDNRNNIDNLLINLLY